MRKVIVGLVLVCMMSGLALAVPAGPGGTFYFKTGALGAVNQKDAHQDIWYFNVNTDWQTVDNDGNAMTTGACQYLDTFYSAGDYFGTNVEFWADETGNNKDMSGQYCNASLTYQMYDVRRPDGTLVALSPGVYQSTNVPGVPNTTGNIGVVAVDSNFLPNGSADGAWGIANSAYQSRDGSVWAYNSGTDLYDSGTAVTALATANLSDYNSAFGVIVGRSSSNITAVYKDAEGTGYTRVDMVKDVNMGHSFNIYSSGGLVRAPGDVDGDGLLDVYYWAYNSTPSIYHYFAHAEDHNGDGDWWDADAGPNGEVAEAWDMGCGYSAARYTQGFEVIQIAPADAEFPGGHWVLVQWYVNTSGVDKIKLWELNAAGNAVSSTYYTLMQGDIDTSLEDMYTAGIRSMGFMPLNAVDNEVPEPGTMLLVGTGILGLAGMVRRRLIG